MSDDGREASEGRAAPALSVFRMHDILAELWRIKAATSKKIEPSIATLNVIVFIGDREQRVRVRERAIHLVEKHPSRLLILDACDRSDRVDVSSSTAVELAVGSLDARMMTAITQELSIHDVPTVLWWNAGRFDTDPHFSALVEHVDRVVVDSSGISGDAGALRELNGFIEARHPGGEGISLGDLAWMRLAPWQDMIAQFFDDPALREDLSSLMKLEITSGSAAEALYLAGWLASRLGWVPSGAGPFVTPEGSLVAFERTMQGEKRRVVRVALSTSISRYVAELSSDDRVVELSVEGAKAKPSWLVPLHDIDAASLIERAILSKTTDELFESTLQTLRELLELPA